MKKILFALFALALFASGEVIAQEVQVRGYTRRDGTYVQPHTRTRPDGNPYNNKSYRGL